MWKPAHQPRALRQMRRHDADETERPDNERRDRRLKACKRENQDRVSARIDTA